MTAQAVLFQRISDKVWILSFRVGDVVEHVNLEKYTARGYLDAPSARVAARRWLADVGVYRLPCPYCGAARSSETSRVVGCTTGNARSVRRLARPHAARFNQITYVDAALGTEPVKLS